MTEDRLTIREASEQDVPLLEDLAIACARPQWDRESLNRMAADRHHLVLVLDVRPGSLTAPPLSGLLLTSFAAGEGDVLDLMIHPDRRRSGFGHKLLRRGLDLLGKKGIRDVFLEVAEPNRGAIALYRKNGFQEIGRRKDYYPQKRFAGEMPGHAILMRYENLSV